MPTLRRVLTPAEQAASMARSRDKIPADDQLRVLSAMLAAADDGQRARMLANVPPAVADLWAGAGRPAHERVHATLLGAGAAAGGWAGARIG